jgi:hypothetical protein
VSSPVAGGGEMGVTGVERGLLLRYQTSAVKPNRIDAARSRTRARGLSDLKKRTGDSQDMRSP